MYKGDETFIVQNRCDYDIGVTLLSGRKPNIQHGSFIRMSADDILYIESIARKRKPFSSKMLVAVDANGKDLTLEEIGGFTDTYAEPHLSKEEIAANLKKSNKSIEAWLSKIEDPVELHAIGEVAKNMDELSKSKLSIVQSKIPNVDLLNSDEE